MDREEYNKRYYDDLEKEFDLEINDLETAAERRLALQTLTQYVQLMAAVKMLPPKVVLVYYRLTYLVYQFLRQTRQIQIKGQAIDGKVRGFVMKLIDKHSYGH